MQRGFRRYLKQKQAQSGERHARPKVSSRVGGRAGVLNKKPKAASQAQRLGVGVRVRAGVRAGVGVGVGRGTGTGSG